MTADEILLAAANGAEPPNLNAAEALLFCRMRESYRAFRAGDISKEAGAEAKKNAMAEYRRVSTKLEQGRAAQFRMAKLWADLERCASAYRKKRDLDTADELMEAVYGIRLGKEEQT